MLEAENYKLILIGIINSIFLGLSNMSHIYNDSTLIKASFTYYGIARRAVGNGGPEGPYPQFLTDQSTPFQGADYANHITTCPPPPSAGYSDLPTSLT